MNADEIVKKAQDEFARLSKLAVNSVIGVAKGEEDGWSHWRHWRERLSRIRWMS